MNSILLSGKEVLPLIEGGKGVSITTGVSSGAWAATGGIGTFSGVSADGYDEQGRIIQQIFKGRTRRERYEEHVAYSIHGGITQAQIAHERSNGLGRIHMNVLWETGGAIQVLKGVLEKAKGLIHGVTCGAGMPYRLAELAAQHEVYYHPIVSSMRAFRALWKRAYHKIPEWLGSVVYEDPWLAGGHNGLSNGEDPTAPEDPYPRVLGLRNFMRSVGLAMIPIIMAGGVWCLREWQDWIDNPELGPIAFQFGTRPLLTQESPISDAWKQRLLTLKKGDVFLNRFSPTGFYSSAVNNAFLRNLRERSNRQVAFVNEPTDGMVVKHLCISPARTIYVTEADKQRIDSWIAAGYTQAMRTPDSTVIFVEPEQSERIRKDQKECMGCLSACLFSSWSEQNDELDRLPDPRSYCIKKTLESIAHNGDIDHNLMFAGHNAFRFAEDPFYANGFIPTVAQLVDRIQTGD